MGRPKGGHPAKRLLKGQTWQVEEMLKLFLVIFVFGGAVLLIIGATGGLTNVLQDFCEKNPAWCGQSATTEEDYRIAKASVDALVEAINCVADPGSCKPDCFDSDGCIFKPDDVKKASFIGNVIAQPQEDDDTITVKCEMTELTSKQMESLGEAGTVEVSTEGTSQSLIEGRAVRACKDKYGPDIEPVPTDIFRTKGMLGWSWGDEDFVAAVNTGRFSCIYKKAITSCDVDNFQLPQEVSKAEDWIMDYGDPKFLVYYQIFPMEQDTWTFKADWKVFAAITLITAIPPTKMVGGAAKVLGTAVRYTTKQAANVALKKVLWENVKKRVFKKAAVVAGLSGTALVAAQVDSKSAVYEPDPGKIALKVPYEEKEVLPLSDKMKGQPVLIHWDPGTLSKQRITPLHLVSPCYPDTMSVEKAKVLCNTYTYNSKTGFVDCDNDKITGREITLPNGEKMSLWETVWDKFFGNEDVPDCKIDSYLEITPFESIDDISKMKINDVIKEIGEKMPEWMNLTYENEDKINLDDITKDSKIPEDYMWDLGFQGGLSGGGGATRSFDLSPDANSVTHKIRLDYEDNKKMYLIDSDFDDYFDSYSLEDCNINAVLIKDFKKKDVKDNNYCVDHRGGYEKTLEYGGATLGVGGVIAAGFLSGGLAWIAGGLAVIGTGLEIAGVYEDYSGTWPN